MKRLEISRLMDEYTDTEFFPEGGTIADTQAVKDRVLAQTGAAKKRRRPPLKTVLLAAALIVTVSAAADAIWQGADYHFMSGGTYCTEGGTSGFFRSELDEKDPVQVMEDGCVCIVDGKQMIDITGLFDEENPYVYTHMDSETGRKGYLIVGGTAENFGWAEVYQQDTYKSIYTVNCESIDLYLVDGEWIEMEHLTEAQFERSRGHKSIYEPWLEGALKEIGYTHD